MMSIHCVEIVFEELEWVGGLQQRDNSEAEKEEQSRIDAHFEPDKVYMKELIPLNQAQNRLRS